METRDNLRFLTTDRIETSLGRLHEVTVMTSSNQRLGTLDGVLVDPDERRVQYLVVAARSWFKTRHYLVPLSTARFVDGGHQLETDIDADALDRLAQVNPTQFHDLADDLGESAAHRPQAA